MDWLISGKEPDSLWVSVLDEEMLSSGAIKRLVELLPWYKKTPRMEVYLAAHLLPVLRSGLERSYILAQIEKLDIPREIAEQFLKDLTDCGSCSFGKPRFYYTPILQAIPYQNSMLVLNQYLNKHTVISQALYKCFEILGAKMERQEYESRLEAMFKSEEMTRKVCASLAQQGLLLSANGGHAPNADHGPSRWSIEITRGGRLLDSEEWAKRLDFLSDSFGLFYFQSRRYFFHHPIRLLGDFNAVMRTANPDYFWDLSFKLQSFYESVPVELKLSAPITESGWQEFRTEAPLLFHWSFLLDLRHNEPQIALESIKFAENRLLPRDRVTLLANGPLPQELTLIKDKAQFRLYYENTAEYPGSSLTDFPVQINRMPLLAYCRREGCAPTASPYIDGQGDVYTCSLEGAAHLGNIDSGAQTIEAQRQQMRRDRTGACKFGVNPGQPAKRSDLDNFLQGCKDALMREGIADFTCP